MAQESKPNTETAIKVSGVSKNFALPHEKVSSMKGYFTRLFNMNRSMEVQHALRDISFEIKKGEFFGIVGRNGSGKSTLLKILAEIYQPTKGSVVVNGKLVPFIELGVGFNPELTGRENVYLNGALLGFSKKEMDERYNEIVAFAELEDFMDQKLKNYSSGMQVRLAFSVAIIADADILLVDEVLAVGDADFQRKCYSYFKSLKKNKKTVVFVSHDMSAVSEYCDRVILVDSSQKVAEGKADDIANEYLKLFNKPEHADSFQATEHRWGAGGVHFDKITAKQVKEHIRITMAIAAEKDMEDLVIGLRIKSGTGDAVTGINTLQSGNGTINMPKGGKITLTWDILNIFSSDLYAIDATIRLSDGVTICDNWDGAASFTIKRKEKTPYVVEPPVELTLSKGK